MRALRDLLLIVLVVAGGLGASQIPNYIQQYEQRLGGALDEAERQLQGFRDIARSSGLEFEQYLRSFEAKPEREMRETGLRIRALDGRAAYLAAHATALGTADALVKPWVLAREGDGEIMRAAWATYVPSLTLDVRFALIGAALGWLVMAFLGALSGAVAPAPRRHRR